MTLLLLYREQAEKESNKMTLGQANWQTTARFYGKICRATGTALEVDAHISKASMIPHVFMNLK